MKKTTKIISGLWVIALSLSTNVFSGVFEECEAQNQTAKLKTEGQLKEIKASYTVTLAMKGKSAESEKQLNEIKQTQSVLDSYFIKTKNCINQKFEESSKKIKALQSEIQTCKQESLLPKINNGNSKDIRSIQETIKSNQPSQLNPSESVQ